MGIGEVLLDHYNQFLGDYIGADVYTNSDYAIQILGFPNAIKDCIIKENDMITYGKNYKK